MPFAVFRRHQRKLLAIFAILAMFGFVLADSLPRLLSGGYGGSTGDTVVVKLYGKSVHRSDIAAMAEERNRANRFVAELFPFPVGPIFGDVSSTRALVDALILQHEADVLKMPRGPEVAKEFLKQLTGGRMSRELFEGALRGSGLQVGGEQILLDIANQVRLDQVRRLLGVPVVTPLDVFRTYRDQTERVAVKAATFPVASFVDKVAEPSKDQVEAYHEKYKDALPDPLRDTPGFKIPRRVKAEVLSIDGAALANSIEAKLTEADLRSYYENRKAEFVRPTGLPPDIFAGDPKGELTPPQYKPFEEVRSYLARSLAEEKAHAEISNRFGAIRDTVMIPFADKYHDVLDQIEEARKGGEATTAVLPRPTDLKSVAAKEGLGHEMTPLLTRVEADSYAPVAGAEVGQTRYSGGRKFAEEVFDPKSSLFEPIELTDPQGRRYLVRKVDDQAPRVPPLDEIRSQVVRAWKMEQARPLAEKAAQAFAARVKGEGGAIKEDQVDGRPVLHTRPTVRMQVGFPTSPTSMRNSPPTPSDIPEIPNAGDELRTGYFELEPGAVAVAPDLPRNVYYVLTLDSRLPASFAALYAPNGDYIRYQREALNQAMEQRDQQWMNYLRKDAGLAPDWSPGDEAKGDGATRS
jgi:peptidyl-prolyl cis-trans isomerase D